MAEITIQYCVVWNYHPRAAGLADDIKKEFGEDATLVKGRDGVFEVTVDGELVYSKRELGRFPNPGEVEDSLRSKLA